MLLSVERGLQMKTVYIYGTDRVCRNVKIVADNYVLQEYETFLSPDRNLLPPYTLNEAGTAWNGQTQEEWLATQPKDPVDETTKSDVILANLLKQNAKMSLMQAKMQKQINAQQEQIKELQSI